MKVICNMCYRILNDDDDDIVVIANPPDGEGIKIFCADCWEAEKVKMGLQTEVESRRKRKD